MSGSSSTINAHFWGMQSPPRRRGSQQGYAATLVFEPCLLLVSLLFGWQPYALVGVVNVARGLLESFLGRAYDEITVVILLGQFQSIERDGHILLSHLEKTADSHNRC